MNNSISAMEIAKFLNNEVSENIEIKGQTTLDILDENCVCFIKCFDLRNIEKINNKRVLAIVANEYKDKLNCPYILSNNPRLDYIKVITKFFSSEVEYKIDETAKVEINVTNVKIGAFTHIEKDVIIGENTIIEDNVSITGKVIIGSNCIIKSGAVIGGSGFGFEYDEEGVPIKFPHNGTVEIGNNVYIGANTCIDRATINKTIIEDNVKIDNLVHIAHNCHIEKNCLIITGAVLCGGSHIANNTTISPNVSVREKLTVGSNSIVGLGAVVVKSLEQNSIYVGNPAKLLKRR